MMADIVPAEFTLSLLLKYQAVTGITMPLVKIVYAKVPNDVERLPARCAVAGVTSPDGFRAIP